MQAYAEVGPNGLMRGLTCGRNDMSWVLDQKKLHITIGSSPQTTSTGEGQKFDLKNDVELVKAALLYGDSAKLCSPASAALLDLVTLIEPPEEERWNLLRRIRSWGFMDEETNSKFSSIMNLSRAGLFLLSHWRFAGGW